MLLINHANVCIQNIVLNKLKGNIKLAVLRLDKLHPIISGNKWFKLKLQLQEVVNNQYDGVVTFGGAYSNHIVSAAYVCKVLGLESVGIIRGEAPKKLSHTLLVAKDYGMDLQFVSRSAYDNKSLLQQRLQNKNLYIIPEGGYAVLGANGVTEMYQWIDETCTHIVCAVGTGTMMAGLIKGALPHQKIVGINVLKGHDKLLNEVKNLLTEQEQLKQFELIEGYHFGGYAKHPQDLINWMNLIYKQHQLPTDLVYTSKLMYGVIDLIQQNYFPANSNVMVVHSGGLQGNLSLPKGTLVFD